MVIGRTSNVLLIVFIFRLLRIRVICWQYFLSADAGHKARFFQQSNTLTSFLWCRRAFKFYSNFVSNIWVRLVFVFITIRIHLPFVCVGLRGKSFNWLTTFRKWYENNFIEKKSSCAESCRHHTKNEVYPRNVVTIAVMLVYSIETRITRSRPLRDVSSSP